MARFFPKSLLGQSLLAIAVTLLIGQAVSGLLLYRAAQDRRDAATVNAAAFHLLRMVNRETDSPRDIRRALRRAEPEGRIDIGRGRGERRRGLPPRLSGMIADASPLLPDERRAAGEEAQLREILARQGVVPDELAVTIRPVAQDTLLAALRVRIESVADETQRARMAEVIEDLRRSLDDILSLARIGRAKDPPEATQLAALVESVVEEFEDVDRPVAIAHTDRIVAPVQVTWLRRALRNLIENALRYGGTAQVSLTREGGTAVIAVEDEGPGIPPEDVAAMLEPFRRGEASRNRGTGGAGLGLTLTRAILAEHGGELRLANRTQGGLRAEMRLPLSA